MKRKVKILILVSIAVLAIIIFAVFTKYYNSLIDVNSRINVIQAIAAVEDKNTDNELFAFAFEAEPAECINTIDYNIIKKSDYAVVLYETAQRNNVLVLKKAKLFKAKYKYFASSSGSSSYEINNFTAHKKDKIEYMSVVSIRNMADFRGADEVKVEMVDSDGENMEFVSDKPVDEIPFLDVYIQSVSDESEIKLNVNILDKDKNIVC